MKKLLKHLSPFAPDQSGATSVLYELGGITVICDAGGCVGNICGFDEPRWFECKSAIFSAGLRDMDAILGRDDRLVKKLSKACEQIDGKFTAIIGTPVPAVIATDYKALKKMAERETKLPCITVECTGTNYYDKGEEETYLQLFKTFAVQKLPTKKGKIGVIGATPLNISKTNADQIISSLKTEGWENPIAFGMGSGLDEFTNASECEKILVIAPGGIKSAEYLKEKFGIPFEMDFPNVERYANCSQIDGKKILIVHQQAAGNALRKHLLEKGAEKVVCATWFMQNDDFAQPEDFKITGEEQLSEAVEQGGFDLVICDKALSRLVKCQTVDFPHFAVSGTLI